MIRWSFNKMISHYCFGSYDFQNILVILLLIDTLNSYIHKIFCVKKDLAQIRYGHFVDFIFQHEKCAAYYKFIFCILYFLFFCVVIKLVFLIGFKENTKRKKYVYREFL